MILDSKNGKKWISSAMDKLHAYLNRAPILVSDITGTENCVDGVHIIHESSKTKKFFPFPSPEFDEDPKIWVHNIKDNLLEFYPRIIENVVEKRAMSSSEMALYIEKSGDYENVPTEKEEVVLQKLWRIDKVQVYKDIFILQLEAIRDNKESVWKRVDDSTPIQNRYKFQGGSSVFFLNKYRNEGFSNQIEAGKEFFENSIFIDELQQK